MKIHITWCTEDILDKATQMGLKLTEEEADDILATVEHHHDCNEGINWGVIEYHIDASGYGNKIKKKGKVKK